MSLSMRRTQAPDKGFIVHETAGFFDLKYDEPVVVGLDLSLTATGLTIMTLDGTESATWVIKSGKRRGWKRMAWLRDGVTMLLMCFTVRSVFTEGFSFGSRNSHAHALGGIGWVVRLALAENGLRVVDVPPGTLKKYTTNKGNCGKAEMLLHVFKHWGVEFADDNAADSYALARAALHIENGETAPKYRTDALTKVEVVSEGDRTL